MLKGFGNIIMGNALGSAAMSMTGNMGSLKAPMDTFISLGMFGNAVKNLKGMFNW